MKHSGQGLVDSGQQKIVTGTIALLMILLALWSLWVTSPVALVEAMPAAACTTTCVDNWVTDCGYVWVPGGCSGSRWVPEQQRCGNSCWSGGCGWDSGIDDYVCWEGGCDTVCWNEGGYWEENCWDGYYAYQCNTTYQPTCTETCTSGCGTNGYNNNGETCTDSSGNVIPLSCNSNCSVCTCPSTQSYCSSDADCGGSTSCPFSTSGGSYLECQAGICASVCESSGNGGGGGGSITNSTSTPIPGVTPTATPNRTATPGATRTPFATPTPIQHTSCPASPESEGGTVKNVIAPTPPDVQIVTLPINPVVVGQDPTQRGVDVQETVTVYACTIDWHYRVQEDYVFCGKATCDCNVDNCEIRQRWKEWDETCTEPYGIAGITIDGQLSTDSVNYINGEMQNRYPGARVQQGSLRFFPNALARQLSYLVGVPTTWVMQGLKYPLRDPGYWDVNTTIVTEPTTHCGPLQWTVPNPKKIPVYLREQTIIK